MSIKEKIVNSKITFDFFYTIGAQIVLNLVIQILIYPLINKHGGDTLLGNIVFYMEIVYIISIGLGNAMCSIRLSTLNKFRTTNYDYNFILKALIPASAIISMAIMYFYDKSIVSILLFGMLSAFTMVRYYISVEYRINLDFKMYFFFFVILSIGYCFGFVLYLIIGMWQLIFLTGEVGIVAFMLIKTNIFKKEEPSGNFSLLIKNLTMMIFSYVLMELLSNFDRLVLKNTLNSNAVSVYYVVSLIGKTMLIFSVPINNLLLSYISTDKNEFTWNNLKKLLVPILLIDIVFYIVCAVATPIFSRVFYPNIYPQIHGLNLIVNAAQIITFTASVVIVVVLATLGSKYHLILQIIYAIVLVPLSIMLTNKLGIWGYACAALISNLVRMVSILFVARKKLSRGLGTQ